MEIWAGIIGVILGGAITATAIILQARGEREERQRDREERQIDRQAELKRQHIRERINPMIEVSTALGSLMFKFRQMSLDPVHNILKPESDLHKILQELNIMVNNRLWPALASSSGVDRQFKDAISELLGNVQEFILIVKVKLDELEIEKNKLRLELKQLQKEPHQQEKSHKLEIEEKLAKLGKKSLSDHLADNKHKEELFNKISDGAISIIDKCYTVIETSMCH